MNGAGLVHGQDQAPHCPLVPGLAPGALCHLHPAKLRLWGLRTTLPPHTRTGFWGLCVASTRLSSGSRAPCCPHLDWVQIQGPTLPLPSPYTSGSDLTPPFVSKLVHRAIAHGAPHRCMGSPAGQMTCTQGQRLNTPVIVYF